MNRFSFSLVAISVIALAACGGQSNEDRSEPLLGLEIGIDDLRISALDARNDCVRLSGYPQMMHAQAMRPSEDFAQRGMVYWNPLESGPMTTSEAEQFGLIGVGTAFEEPVPGDVVSSDDGFDRTIQSCDEQINNAVGEDLTASFATWTEFSDEVRDEFLVIAIVDAGNLISEQESCFANAVGLSADDIDFSSVLEQLEIAEGTTETPESTVAVYEGIEVIERPRTIYRPSDREVEVAKSFAKCSTDIDFANRLDQLQEPIRATVLENHADDIAGFAQWSNTTREQLDGYTPTAVTS